MSIDARSNLLRLSHRGRIRNWERQKGFGLPLFGYPIDSAILASLVADRIVGEQQCAWCSKLRQDLFNLAAMECHMEGGELVPFGGIHGAEPRVGIPMLCLQIRM